MFLHFALHFALVMVAVVCAQDCSLNTTLHASFTEKEFSIPQYPSGFPINKTCGWYIKAPENHFIKLRFTPRVPKFSLKCLQIFDVFDMDGSDLSPINVERFYPKINSSAQFLYILFQNKEKYAISHPPKARYTAVKSGGSCSSQNSKEENMNILLRSATGILKTPGFPHGYPHGSIRDCFWKLIAPKGKVVRLTFMTFQMHINDQMKIFDSWNWWYPWKINRQEPWRSFTVYSTGRRLAIKVTEDLSTTYAGAGFIANYTMVPAGELLGTCVPKENSIVHMTGEGRSFSSPGFPLNPGNGTCSWHITVPAGQFVKLTFWEFGGECDVNYAEVFDVTLNSSRKLLRKFCVSEHLNQQVLYSEGNNVIVKHSSLSASNEFGGFTATFEAVKVRAAPYSCSNDALAVTFEDTSGEFASFDYPRPYPNNVRCWWNITAPVGYVIRLTFHSFELQQSQDCQKDYVEVQQWSGFKTKRFCGSSLPPVFQSKYYKLFVIFQTDSFKTYPGFHASYTFLPDPAIGPCKVAGVDNIIPMSGEAGSIFSPQFPPDKPIKSITCTWIITVPQGQFVKLRVTNAELGSTRRNSSSMVIRDGENVSSPLVKSFYPGDFVGAMSYFSSGRHLWVRYMYQQVWNEFLQFAAEYEAVKQLPASYACTRKKRGWEFHSGKGIFASLNYPLAYDEFGACDWKIHTSTFKLIELSFDVFNLSDPSPTCKDYIQIRTDGIDYRSNTPKICGSEKPSPVTSKGSKMEVYFYSHGSSKYPGFKARYKTKFSTKGIVIIVASCIGVTSVCVLLTICAFKCCKSQRCQVPRSLSDRAVLVNEAQDVALLEQPVRV